ncbi:MAG: hypothetical protein PHY08_04360 [Candidatus Cloacimonetes bacterium]|jgi:hypothetical protein|nr:hypothetical protein [Candidatus Cloacimonadota bacterium]MDD4155787.1 hypothetical protein [Candidatus Cloacimonadota bacterium]
MQVEVSKERALELIDKVAVFFASRRMGAPALLFLESMRPLHFIGSQIMYFLSPFAGIIFKGEEFEEFAALLSDHENVQLLINRIDELDEKFNEEQRKLERIKRKKNWEKFKSFFKKKNKNNNGGKL